MSEYKNKIENLLKSIIDTPINKERPSEVKTEVPEVIKNLKTIGVKETIKKIFNEEYTIEQNISTEDDLQIKDSTFYRVKIGGSYPDVDSYWKSIEKFLRNLGDVKVDSLGGLVISFVNKEKTPIKIYPVRDSAKAEQPAIAIEKTIPQNITKEEVKEYLSSVGLINNLDMVELGDIIVAYPHL